MSIPVIDVDTAEGSTDVPNDDKKGVASAVSKAVAQMDPSSKLGAAVLGALKKKYGDEEADRRMKRGFRLVRMSITVDNSDGGSDN